MRAANLLAGLAMVFCFPACSNEALEDGPNDSFMQNGKADDFNIQEGSPEACGVLKLVNESDASKLKNDAGLAKRAANNIYNYRIGADKIAQTADDNPIETLAELDAISYVGPQAFEKLLAYASSHNYACDNPDTPPPCTGIGGKYDGITFTKDEECKAVDFLNRAKWSDLKSLPIAARRRAYFCRPGTYESNGNAVECGNYRPLKASIGWSNLADISNSEGIGKTSMTKIKSASAVFAPTSDLPYDTVSYVWTNRAQLQDAPVLFERVFVTKRVADEVGTFTYFCVELRDSPNAPNWIEACQQGIPSDFAPVCAHGPGCLDDMLGRFVQLEGTVRKSSLHPGGYKINLSTEQAREAHPDLPALDQDPQCKETWCRLSREGSPSDRTEQVSAWTETELIVWGGRGWNNSIILGGKAEKPLGDGARYNPELDRWTSMSSVKAPSARYGASTVFTGTEMIVWGGTNGINLLGDGARYNPATDSWSPMSTQGAPEARHDAMVVWTGTEMIVWGGLGDTEPFRNGARYNPASDTWSVMEIKDSPSVRIEAVFVWTGAEFLVWGGKRWEDPEQVSDGALYDPMTNTWRPVFQDQFEFQCVAPAFGWTGSQLVIWSCVGESYDPQINQWTLLTNTNISCELRGPKSVWTGRQLVYFGRQLHENLRLGSEYWFGAYNPSSNEWSKPVFQFSPGERQSSTFVWTGNYLIVWGGEAHWGVTGTGARLILENENTGCSEVEPGNGGEGEPCSATDQCDGRQYCNQTRCVCYPPRECVEASDCDNPGNDWTHDSCAGHAECQNGLCAWSCN